MEGPVAIAACVAAIVEAARAEALKVGGDVGGRVGGVDGAPVSAPVWLAVNMAAWRQPRKGNQQTSSEIFRTAGRGRSSGRAQIYNLTAAWRLTRAVGYTDSVSPTAKRFGGKAQRGGAQRLFSHSNLSFSNFV